MDKLSYALGLSLAQNFKGSGISSINADDFADALREYGFIDAIYLTGGSNEDTFYRDLNGDIHGKPNWKDKPWNLLLFKKT